MLGLTFRELLDQGTMVETPMIYEAQQAKIAVDVGFEALTIGSSFVATHVHGMPDGWQTAAELVHQIQTVCEVADVPVLIDLDDAGSTPPHVYRNVRNAEAAGAGAILLEDLDCANRFQWDAAAGGWDYSFAGRLRPLEAAADLLSVARSAIREPGTILIGRTDALLSTDLDEAMRRARAYVATGVDAMFISMLPNDLVAEVGAELGVPIMNVVAAPTTSEERDAVVNTGLRICVYSGHVDLYRANVEALWKLASLIPGNTPPELSTNMRKWLAYGIPAPLLQRLGGADLEERFGLGAQKRPATLPGE